MCMLKHKMMKMRCNEYGVIHDLWTLLQETIS
jgi:hypothetical protein